MAAAEPWPSRPLRISVSFPAGSSPDLLARLVAPLLSASLGQPVVVDNKVGASGAIGVQAVAQATDDHLVGFTSSVPITSATLLSRVPYVVARDLTPVSLVATSPLVLAVDAKLDAPDLAALVRLAREQPGALNYGTPGVGSGGHLTMELLNVLAGMRTTHVPYQSYPQALNAILAGQVQLAFMVPSVALQQARAGRIRLLGVSSSKRSALLPQVPAIADSLGGKPFNAEVWTAVVGPARMDRAHAAFLSSALRDIVRSPGVRSQLLEQGWEAVGGSSEALAIRVREDTRTWAGVVRTAGVKGE